MNEVGGLNSLMAIMTWWAALMQALATVVLYYRGQRVEPGINLLAAVGFLGLATRFTFLIQTRGAIPVPWWSSASILLLCLASIALAGYRTTRL